MSVLVLVSIMELFLGVWNAPPASLGELAFREAVRRQASPDAVRAWTSDDVGGAVPRELRPDPAQLVATDVPPGGVAAGTTADPEVSAELRDEAWWRARIGQARAALERDRVLVAALENRVSTLNRDVVNRDDPAQRAVLMAERARALEELDLMTKQVTADTEAIATIEEEARRAGVPPGWIRINSELASLAPATEKS